MTGVGGHLEVVFLDIGGVMYDDAVYSDALLRALRDLGADVSDEAFEREYERCRELQRGSFRRRLAGVFLGGGVEREDLTREVRERAARYWSYPPEALESDVITCLEELHGRYRLGVLPQKPHPLSP